MLSATSYAKADQWQPLQTISNAAEFHVKNHFTENAGNSFTAKAGKLDNRLKLALCQNPLETKTHGKAQTTQQIVAVKCSQPSWKVYVSVKTVRTEPVVVVVNRLNRGDVISLSDIKIESQQTNRLRNGWFTRLEQVLGRTLKRGISSGQPVTGNHLQKNWLINRNQPVKLVANARGLSVAMKGKALSNAELNSIVAVKNLSSGKTVEGVVIGPGIVRID
ncbi:flagellar basal body P-ring formation chaperone FlgA [Pelagibaculum spongiae]|nr:flagellar basal body P-ring formation chaperone FlgA [Pelagibaculum spongiae]